MSNNNQQQSAGGNSSSPHPNSYRGTGAPSSSYGNPSNFSSATPHRGFDGRGRGQGSRYDNANSNMRTRPSYHPSSAPPDERRPYHAHRGGGGYSNNNFNSNSHGRNYSGPSLSEEGPRTKLSSYVTPHDAVQAQPAQHGASIVRSGSSATEGGSILFFSSVQKKGGAFTATERETYAQLRQSRAIAASNRGGRGSNVVGAGIMTRNVARQFDELEKTRAAQAVQAAKNAVTASKRSRFTLASDDEDLGDEEEEDEEGEEDVKTPEPDSEPLNTDKVQVGDDDSDGEGELPGKKTRLENLHSSDSDASP